MMNQLTDEQKEEKNIKEIKEDIKREKLVLSRGNYKGLLEAILLVEAEPISYSKLAKMIQLEIKEIRKYIEDLKNEYVEKDSGFYIAEIAGGIKLTTNPVYGEILKKFYKKKNKLKFSKASLETLAIIAYKQPITKAEIEDIRGVSSDFVIRDLMEKKLIKKVGQRKDAPGKPMQYGTTKEFLMLFGLKNIKELPTLKEIKELNFE